MTSVRLVRSKVRSRQRQGRGEFTGRAVAAVPTERAGARLLRHRFLQPLDLRGVAVRVGRVDLEPAVGGVETGLGVPALELPVVVGHDLEQLERGRACGAKRLERGLDGAGVVAEQDREAILVVAL